MELQTLKFLVIENAPDVCEGIIRRMEKFSQWASLGFCVGVQEAIEVIEKNKPQLLFLDWSLNGGSAFEILQYIQNKAAYNPYVIFNTGYQKDNPEIPQEVINNYKVDKYLVKPIWETLRNNLPQYLIEAEAKAASQTTKEKIVWLTDDEGHKQAVNLLQLICVCQHPTHARQRIFYFFQNNSTLSIPLQWQKIIELLQLHEIDFFITKHRGHLVVKSYIEKYEKPFVRLKGVTAFKIDVVKESCSEFEKWLIQ